MLIEFFWIILFAFIVSSLVKGWSGFGTNLIAMPFLIAFLGFQNTDAVTIVISINVFMNIAILVENKKFNIKSLDNIKVMVIFGVIFTFVGQYFLNDPDYDKYVKIIAGALIVLAGMNKIITMKYGRQELFKEATMSKYFIPAGIISGIFNGIAGLGGLPALIILSNSDLKREQFRTTLVAYFFVMNVVALIGFVINRNYSPFVLQHIGVFLIPSVLLCMVGVYLSRRVSDKVFSYVMLGVLFFMGINLVINGVTGQNILNFLFV
jgi:uncharacterized membrane protein YfcA